MPRPPLRTAPTGRQTKNNLASWFGEADFAFYYHIKILPFCCAFYVCSTFFGRISWPLTCVGGGQLQQAISSNFVRCGRISHLSKWEEVKILPPT
jgi:hypothetical protein